jgi:hypothetical protein
MTITGTITGTVEDPSGHAIAGAKVTVISDRTHESRSTVSNESGAFSLVAVQPDSYSLRIEQAGFKAHERRGVVVAANERLALRRGAAGRRGHRNRERDRRGGSGAD